MPELAEEDAAGLKMVWDLPGSEWALIPLFFKV